MKNNSWNGMFHNVRIRRGSHPELYQALEQVPQRERPERLRALAVIGLTFMGTGYTSVSREIVEPRSSNAYRDGQLVKKLTRKLLESVEYRRSQ